MSPLRARTSVSALLAACQMSLVGLTYICKAGHISFGFRIIKLSSYVMMNIILHLMKPQL